MRRFPLKSVLSVLITSLLIMGGQVPPASAAASVTLNTADIVRPGQSNTETLVVTLTGLGNISGANVAFTGITLNPSYVFWTSVTVSSAGWNQCPGAGFMLRLGGGSSQSSSSKCGTTSPTASWDNGGNSVDVGGSISFAFTAGSLVFASSGPYELTVGVGYGNYGLTTLNLAKSPQSSLFVTSTSGTFGSALALTTSGGSGTGDVSFAATNGTALGCAVSGTSLTVTQAGTCNVTATKASDSTYSSVISSATTVTLNKASRSLGFGATTQYTLAFGSTQTVTATPTAGVGDGVISYSKTGTGCTVNSMGVISVSSSTGSCVVSASITEGANYLAATTTTQVSVNGTVKTITVVAGSPSVNFGTNFTPTALVTGLVGDDAADNTNTNFTFTGINGTTYGPTSVKPTDAGVYRIEASNLVILDGAVTDYNIASYSPGTLTINKVGRTLGFTSAATITVAYGDSTTVVAAPNAGDGIVSYAVSSGTTACSINTSTGVVTVTASTGTCVIEAAIATGTNHLSAATASPVTVTVTSRAITITASSRSITVGGSFTANYSVSSGTLANSDAISSATYRYAGSGSTVYTASTTAPTAVGTYSITPSGAVFSSGIASNYIVTYAAGTLTIASKLSRTLSLAATTSTAAYGDALVVVATASAGSSEGTITFSGGSSTACTVGTSTGLVSVTAGLGTCSISATISEGTSHLAASTTTPFTVTVTPRALTITAGSSTVAYGGTVTPTFSISTGGLQGSDSISAVTYAFVGTGSTSYPSSTDAPSASGTYAVSASAPIFSSGLGTNYAVSFAEGQLTINQSPSASASVSLTAGVGASISGASVVFSASGLHSSATYTVVLRSTPQTIAQGTAVGGSVTGSSSIPQNLAAGWHSATFSSTAADGSTVTEVFYFKVSASGMVLSTSSDKPAELASTGFDTYQYLVHGLLLLIIGLGMTQLVSYRRRRTS